MEKDALLEILSHDLKEVDSLMQSVKGNKELSQAFFKLTRNRIKSIVEELEMLEELSGFEKNQNSVSSTLKTAPESESEKKREPEIAEPETKTDANPKDEIPSSDEPILDLTEENEPFEKPTHPTEQRVQEAEEIKEKEKPTSEATEQSTEKEPDISEESSSKQISEEEVSEKITEPAPSQESKKDSKVLGEKLSNGKSSFNEKIAQNQSTSGKKRSFTSPPISDLKKALGINDRFFFQRELFGNNADLMTQTLDQLNDMNGINDAQGFLLANFNWDPENEAVLRFMELVERRYL